VFVTFCAARIPVAGVVTVDQTLLLGPVMGMSGQLETALRSPNFAAAFEPVRQSIGVEMLPEPLRSETLATQTVRQDLVVAYWYDVGHPSPEEMQLMVDEAVGEITVPFLAIFGHQLPDEDRAYLQQHVAALELEEWPERGHMVFLMETDRFADRLAAFIESMRALPTKSS
jgi:pimeloyl-ACP methyl ester carboxylesterase